MENQEQKSVPVPTPTVEKKFYQRWWFWLIVAVVILYLIGSRGNDNNNSNPAQSTQSTGDNQPVNTAQPTSATPVTAVQLFNEYQDNEVAADAKYKGKYIEVSGTIRDIGKDLFDKPYIGFELGTENVFGVQCLFTKNDEKELATLVKNTEITVKGRVTGKIVEVTLENCLIVKK